MNQSELLPIKRAIKAILLQKQPVVVAVDGPSGSGKSTLTKALVQEIGAVRIDQDDFYRGGKYDLLAAMSDKERAEYEIDWQRMKDEALLPLLAGRAAHYHPFDWNHQEETNVSTNTITLQPASVIIIDGVFSSRKELTDLVDLSVLVHLGRSTRKERLAQREGDGITHPLNALWDKAETFYFEHIRSSKSFDLVINR